MCLLTAAGYMLKEHKQKLECQVQVQYRGLTATDLQLLAYNPHVELPC